jgi:hypothetical protein
MKFASSSSVSLDRASNRRPHPQHGVAIIDTAWRDAQRLISPGPRVGGDAMPLNYCSILLPRLNPPSRKVLRTLDAAGETIHGHPGGAGGGVQINHDKHLRPWSSDAAVMHALLCWKQLYLTTGGRRSAE